MSYRPYLIEVSGSIIAKEGKNYTQGWVAHSDVKSVIDDTIKPIYNLKLHSFSGNLFLDKNTRAVPYAHYVAKEDVIVEENVNSDVDLSCSSGFFPAFAYFGEYIKDIRTALDNPLDEGIDYLYYNGLYVSAFSILELFLCDFLMCGVFSSESYFMNALTSLNIADTADRYDIENKIKNVIFKKVFHKFNDIKCIFNSVFGFGFPDYTLLNQKIHRRHNIVHRFSLSNYDRMTVCNASYDEVLDLIRVITIFVEEMKGLCNLN